MPASGSDNVGPITGRAGTEPRSTDRNYTAGPVRCIGWLSGTAGPPPPARCPAKQKHKQGECCEHPQIEDSLFLRRQIFVRANLFKLEHHVTDGPEEDRAIGEEPPEDDRELLSRR